MILLFEDVPTYLPNLVGIDETTFDAYSRYAQILAESSLGANRPLEPYTFSEILDINRNVGTTFPSYLPLGVIAFLKVRTGRVKDYARRGVPVGPWEELDSDSYDVDVDGAIIIAPSTGYDFGRGGGSCSYLPVQWTEAWIEYESGIDTTEDTVEVRALKQSIAAIVNYLIGSSGAAQGIKEYSSANQFTQKYNVPSAATGSTPGTTNSYGVPEMFFIPFKKYAPQGSVV